jgi:hypothetical protein
MILFFLFVITIAAIIILMSLFAPHMLPWYRPHLILNPSEMQPLTTTIIRKQPIIIEGLAEFEIEGNGNISLEEKESRLDHILIEKNSMIEKLQKQLIAEKSHRLEFEKVKGLLDKEILNLRKQNKEFKIRTGEEA